MLGIALGIRNISSQLPDLVYALLSGLNAATVGLIALAAVQLSERQITNQMTRLIICVTACVGLLYRGISRLEEIILIQRYGTFQC
jgi:chromate transport protein ChrA